MRRRREDEEEEENEEEEEVEEEEEENEWERAREKCGRTCSRRTQSSSTVPALARAQREHRDRSAPARRWRALPRAQGTASAGVGGRRSVRVKRGAFRGIFSGSERRVRWRAGGWGSARAAQQQLCNVRRRGPKDVLVICAAGGGWGHQRGGGRGLFRLARCFTLSTQHSGAAGRAEGVARRPGAQRTYLHQNIPRLQNAFGAASRTHLPRHNDEVW